MRQAFGRGFYLGGALAGAMTATKGRFPPGDARTERDAEQALISTDRAKVVSGARREADVRQALVASSRRATARATTSRTTSASRRRCRASWRRCGRACAPRRSTRSAQPDGEGTVEVKLTPSNCVQCGAITAKGGRLTPPEGGSGPRVHAHVTPSARARHGGCHRSCPREGRELAEEPELLDRLLRRPAEELAGARHGRAESQRTRARSSPHSSSTRALRRGPGFPHVVGSGRRTAPRS